MKNIDYVMSKKDPETYTKKMIIKDDCPSEYGLKELDCMNSDEECCNCCWNLELSIDVKDGAVTFNTALKHLLEFCNNNELTIIHIDLDIYKPLANVKYEDGRIRSLWYNGGDWEWTE